MNVLAIRTAFSHHGKHTGYKELLNHTKPVEVLGNDENKKLIWPFSSYHFLYEFRAKMRRLSVDFDLVHILYGENYYRFSKFLFPNLPVVVTYHQPCEILRREVLHGDGMGRVAGFTHRITRSRLAKADAVILTSKDQLPAISDVVADERVHVIPLGANVRRLIELSRKQHVNAGHDYILTVGNWKRDWNFYFSFIEHCRVVRPKWKFKLVNRKLGEDWRKLAITLPNLQLLDSVDDDALNDLYQNAAVQFIPFVSAAGNNAVNESLALGCPIVSNIQYDMPDSSLFYKIADNTNESFVHAIDDIMNWPVGLRTQASAASQNAAMAFDWSTIAAKTMQVYEMALERYRLG